MPRPHPRVAITGMGAISPFGVGARETQQALRDGATAATEIEAFDASKLRVRHAGQIRFDPRDHFGKRNYRPVDRTGQLAIIASGEALDSSGWNEDRRQSHDVGLVLGTMFGSVHTISAFDRRGIEAGPKYVKPLDFANTVINAAAGQTAIWHDMRGTNSTVAGGTIAGHAALAQGCELIRQGRATALATGGADELCFESFYGFHQANLLASSNGQGLQAWPFGDSPSGMVVSEGAALVMLEAGSQAIDRGADILGWLAGHGAAFDPSRGRDLESSSRALERAIRQALSDARRQPEALDAVAVGACGLATDLAERSALEAVLGERAQQLPVSAIAPRLGSTLGAAGAFQLQAVISAMNGSALPALVDLGSPRDIASEPSHSASRELAIGCALITGIGLDGAAVALIVEKP